MYFLKFKCQNNLHFYNTNTYYLTLILYKSMLYRGKLYFKFEHLFYLFIIFCKTD